MSDPRPSQDWPPGAPGSPELATLDAQIAVLMAQSNQARAAWQMAESQLAAVRQRRYHLLEQLRAMAQPVPTGKSGFAPGSMQTAPAPMGVGPLPPVPPAPPTLPTVPATGPEASTRTVQNILFVLGGILLGTAAIVFTAVAWASYGVGGRAAILAVVTLLALAAPLVALRRRLTATAETFAAVGLLLVVLDGYAAWYVDLFGLAGTSSSRYAALVALVTAVVGAGYGGLTRLTGPGFVALLAIQPVLPLLAGPLDLTTAGWSLVATGVCAVNLLVIAGSRTGPTAAARRIAGWVLYGGWLAVGALIAAIAEALVRTGPMAALAGLAVIAVAAVLAGGAAVSREEALRSVAACLCLLAVTLAASVYVGVSWPGHALIAVAAVVCAVALPGWATGQILGGSPPRTDGTVEGASTTLRSTGIHSGTAAGAMVGLGAFSLALAGFTVAAAGDTLARAVPFWRSTLATTTRFDWQLLAAIVLVAAAGWVVAGRRGHWLVVTVAAIALVLAIPGSISLAWWAPSVVDLVAAGVLLIGAILPRPMRATIAPALAAALLALHGVLASLGRPESTAAVLGGLVLLGLAGAALGRSTGAGRIVAGWSITVGLLAVAPGLAAALVAADRAGAFHVDRAGQDRLIMAAVALGLVALIAVHRWRPALVWYAFGAVLVSTAVWPLVVVVFGRGAAGSYGGVGLLLVALALLPMTGTATQLEAEFEVGAAVGAAVAAALTSALLVAVDALPAVFAVLGGPYAWLRAIWTGHYVGVGLTPADSVELPAVTAVAAWSLGLLAVASAVAAYAVTRRVPAALGGLGVGGPTAIVVACVAAGLRWPTVPAVTLGLGLLFLAVTGIVRVGPLRSTVAAGQGVLFVGAGLAGALTARWSTIVALASIVVVAAVVGAVGRTVAWRVGGWVSAVAATLGLAIAVGLAADLTVRATAFGVLAVAVVALALGAALRSRRPAESTAVSAAAHAGAVVALLLTTGWIGHTAVVSAVWGLAVGLRALWPGTSRSGRAALAATGAGWELIASWLLLADRGVTAVEAYTIPLAVVGLIAGWAALRRRPELRSWVSYGPALAAALLPSLAIVLTGSGGPWRRLLLGTGALLITVAGAVRRRQAPVVAGGTTLIIIALHEVILIRDLLPRWSVLAVAGLILVGLAITYERRRRDLARLRDALSRMT